MANKKYGYCETTDLQAVYGGGHIHSVRMTKDRENGELVYLGDFEKDSTEVKKEGTKGKLCLVCTPEVVYEHNQRPPFGLFYNEKDSVARAYDLFVNDRFAVSEELLDKKATVGKYLLKGTDGKYKVDDNGNTGEFIAKIYAVETKGDFTLYKAIVLKNEPKA